MKNYKVYVHKVNTEDGPLYYTGVTGQKTSRRWRPCLYQTHSLKPYIDKYGWNAMEHTVAYETTDRVKAYEIEDMLIWFYRSIGREINQLRSGLVRAKNPKEYDKKRSRLRYVEHKDEILLKQKQYYLEHIEERRSYNKKYHKEKSEEVNCRRRLQYLDGKEEILERNRNYYSEHKTEILARRTAKRSTPEGKIYNRVSNFNRQHPDRSLETPLEAKRKYLETGYIPDYIKNDDLK